MRWNEVADCLSPVNGHDCHPSFIRMSSYLATLQSLTTLAAWRHHRFPFHFNWGAQPIMALVAGLFILIRPKLLNFIVAVYLILVGLMGLFGLPW